MRVTKSIMCCFAFPSFHSLSAALLAVDSRCCMGGAAEGSAKEGPECQHSTDKTSARSAADFVTVMPSVPGMEADHIRATRPFQLPRDEARKSHRGTHIHPAYRFACM